MTLKEYVNAFPRLQRMEVRGWLAKQLGISEVYVRSMCNGTKPIPGKFALSIEKLTSHAVPRYVTAPQMYPKDEYLSIHQSKK
ncbi:MAG: helix-turn-helix domain-containing protein [Gammaproteobacteria bacterium]|nr:helix-turn-helix domain-containing protein [Gammaproteobacteria bacterium]